MGMPPHYTQMILGGLVLAAVLLDTREARDPAAAGMSERLAAKVALVIGAPAASVQAIAARLAEEGARVMIADTHRRRSDRRSAIDIDISRKADAERAVAATIARHGRLDILVQNAGIYPWTLIENIEPEEWDRCSPSISKGTYLAARAALAVMKAQRYGRMIFTSSITGPRVTSPGHGHYSASKAGINGFIKAAALEFSSYGITVNGVEPGNILTEGMQAQRSAELHPLDGGRRSRSAGSARRAISPTPSCFSPPMTRPTSPARPSSSTAAKRCRKARTSVSRRAKG